MLMAHLARTVAPLAYEAFEEHLLYAKTFSRSELELLLEALDREGLEKTLARAV